MTKEQLIAEAAKLQQPSKNAGAEYAAKRGALAELLIAKLLETDGFDDVLKTENTDIIIDNINNQFKFMESMYHRYDPQTFVNTIMWAFTVYLNHGFDKQFWDYLLPAALDIYRENLSEQTFSELSPFYSYIQQHKAEFIKLAGF